MPWALLRLEREEDLRQVLEQVRRRNLTVEQTEALIEDCLGRPQGAGHPGSFCCGITGSL